MDRAVEAAQKAFDTVWGLHTSGAQRGKLMMQIAEAIEANIDEIAAVEVGRFLHFKAYPDVLIVQR